MRSGLAASFKLAVLSLFMPVLSPSFAAVRETVATERYVVRGEAGPEVRKQLNRKGPQGYDAYTSWNILWNFTYRKKGGKCVMQSVATRVDIRHTMPRLETGSSELKKSFNKYLESLQVHEDGHAEIGRDVARRIDQGIKGLSDLTCEKLGVRANALGYKIIKEGNALDLKYDAETGHGQSQGAIWN